MTTHLPVRLVTVFAAMAALSSATACTAPSGDDAADGANTQDHLEQDRGSSVTAVATSARVELGMVKLEDEVIISEAATPTNVKPGFSLEVFAPTTLKPVAGLHGPNGLELRARDMAVVNFAPVAALAQRSGGSQDAALYLDSSIAPDGLYGVPTELSSKVPYTGKPGVAVTEAVCDFSQLMPEDKSPYPGLLAAGSLVDGRVHGGVVTMNAKGAVKIRLVAQVERCSRPITSDAQANAEPRLCYEKLVWLKSHGKANTEIGRLSAYRAPLTLAQTSYCGD